MTTWRYASSSDVGLVRDVNEDALHTDAQLAVIADGMGGAAAGEVASAIAVGEIVRGFSSRPTSDGLVEAVVSANRAIIADARSHPERLGMGTTVVALGLVASEDGARAVIVNVGDSRAYQLRDGALRQITADHSVAEEWVRQGRISPEEAAVHPRRHQLTRTLGVEEEVQPDLFFLGLEPGDRVLLCSDGLSNELSDDEIASIAAGPGDLEVAVATLVERANLRGGRDNITAILLEFADEIAAPLVDATTSVPAQLARVEPDEDRRDDAAMVDTDSATTRPRRPRRLTWRAALFVLALAAVVAAAYAVMDWYESSSYYLADDHGRIAIYHGQPGGFLWFTPVFVAETPYHTNQLLTSSYDALIEHSYVEPTYKEARITAQNLHRLWRSLIPPPATTTTTTTTFVPSATTAGG